MDMDIFEGFYLVKNTISMVENVGKKSVHGVKKGVNEVFGFLSSGASLAMDGFNTGLKKGSNILTMKRGRSRSRSRRNRHKKSGTRRHR